MLHKPRISQSMFHMRKSGIRDLEYFRGNLRQSRDLILLTLTFSSYAKNSSLGIMDPFESLNKVINPLHRKIHTHKIWHVIIEGFPAT